MPPVKIYVSKYQNLCSINFFDKKLDSLKICAIIFCEVGDKTVICITDIKETK